MPVTKKSKPVNGHVPTRNKAFVDKVEEISPQNPVPFEGGRGFSSVADMEYLPFLEGDDNFSKLLLQSRLLSCTQNACINTKKSYCAGAGFQLLDDIQIADKKFKDWIKSLNIKNESSTEINKQIFESHFTFGNTPIELVRFTVGNKKFLYVYVHNVLEWRLGRPGLDDGVTKYAIQSKLFLKDNYFLSADELSKARVLPIYNPRFKDKSSRKFIEGNNWVRDANGTERTLIWYKHSTAGFPNYGLPSSVASLIYQQLEYKGARFNLDNLQNGAVISGVLALKGSVTEPEINKIGKRVVSTHTGDGKRGRVMVVGSEQGIDGSDFHSFDTHKEGSYSESDEIWSQKIILANEWDALLAGIINTASVNKGAGFLAKVLEAKKNTVIIPAQQDLVDNVWSHILTVASKWLGFNIDIENIQIKNNIDISGLTDVDITPAVKINEVRRAKGLPLDNTEKGEMYLGELKSEQMKGVYTQDPEEQKESKKQKRKTTKKKEEPDVSSK